MTQYQSWGRTYKANQEVIPLYWQKNLPDLNSISTSALAYGNGRSYGDVCLNDGGTLLDTANLNHFLDFNPGTGLLTVEAGVTLSSILQYFVPRGWFLPVTPGTQYVTVGGAVANDIHGKNHHCAGTFGCHVEAFELIRSSGERLVCSWDQNSELFSATIGGLGLTGIILWVSFKMKRITSPMIQMESIRFKCLEEFFEISKSSDNSYEFSMAWVDCLSQGNSLGRGHFMRGDFSAGNQNNASVSQHPKHLMLPFDLPSFVLNSQTVKVFNHFYFHRQKEKILQKTIGYEAFFYPLDFLSQWNRMYGSKGFFQFQCVVPKTNAVDVMKRLFQKISASGQGSFLSVLKEFGDIKSPGLMSFPKPGYTLALDFSNRGEKTIQLLRALEDETLAAGGALNPSKDACMKPESFKAFYPQWKEFLQYKDPKFSSSFWRRVTKD